VVHRGEALVLELGLVWGLGPALGLVLALALGLVLALALGLVPGLEPVLAQHNRQKPARLITQLIK